MLGGPILGVAVFLIAAFLLGWGLISLLNIQLDGAAQDGGARDLDSRFDTEAVYIVQRDMLLGVNQDANAVMFYPDYDALPSGTPNRRYIPRVGDYLADPGNAEYADTLGVIVAGTRIRFERLAEEPTNRQARFIVHTLILDGEHEGIHARGMFLETQTPGDAGQRIVSPREDLFQPADATPAQGDESAATDEPIQSPVERVEAEVR